MSHVLAPQVEVLVGIREEVLSDVVDNGFGMLKSPLQNQPSTGDTCSRDVDGANA